MVSDNMHNISHRAVIRYLGLKGLTYKEIHEDMVVILVEEGMKEMFYLTTHSTHFIYGYVASDIW